MNWAWFAITFVCFWLLRSIYYWSKLRSLLKLKTEYQKYLSESENNLFEHRAQIISLLKEANVKDFLLPHVEPVGFGQIQVGNMSGLSNIHLRREDVVIPYMMKFDEAIGVFKHRMKQSYNPFYWVELTLMLPKKVLSYVDVGLPDSIMKMIQLLYWAVMILVALHGVKIIDLSSWIR